MRRPPTSFRALQPRNILALGVCVCVCVCVCLLLLNGSVYRTLLTFLFGTRAAEAGLVASASSSFSSSSWGRGGARGRNLRQRMTKVYRCINVCMYMYICICICVYLYADVYMCVYTHIYAHASICMYVCVCMCTCMSACMYVCVCVCVCVCLNHLHHACVHPLKTGGARERHELETCSKQDAQCASQPTPWRPTAPGGLREGERRE